jgi:uncharacterized membrane protein (DUF4010 family)
MDIGASCMDLAIALALGLLVGVQRERSGSVIAGVRTFGLIGVAGALAVMVGGSVGGGATGAVVVAATGLLGVVVLAVMGNVIRGAAEGDPGVTTEMAMVVVFLAGALAGSGERTVATIVGVATAVLLYAKPSLHKFSAAMSDADLRAVLQFAVIAFIVLPMVPDRAMGPFGALNPRDLWVMVVLVVGIGIGGYVAHRLVGGARGAALSGVIGGLISSTAATASFARRVRGSPAMAPIATVAILLASMVVHVRVLVELGVVAPKQVGALAGPIGALMGVSVVLCVVAWMMARRSAEGPGLEPGNPAELRSALVFGGVLALVQVAAAAATEWFGDRGLYAVAAISGLTDLDAITLSSGKMAADGGIGVAQAGTAIAIAMVSNVVMKSGIAVALAGWRGARRVVALNAVYAAACVVVGVVWMPRLV